MPQSRYTTEEEIEAMRQAISRALAGRGRTDGARGRWYAPKIACAVLFGAVILLLLAILLSVFLQKNRGEIPGVLGYHLFVVESGSMEPTLPVGSVILSRRPADPGELAIDEIVTFKTASGDLVTHRISGVFTGEDGSVSYRTKGDNPLSSPDQELLTPDRIIAVFLVQISSPWSRR
ncbi:MAG: signal peptidase I [Dethiobacteria bacterium]|jgi:signal peptidase